MQDGATVIDSKIAVGKVTDCFSEKWQIWSALFTSDVTRMQLETQNHFEVANKIYCYWNFLYFFFKNV